MCRTWQWGEVRCGGQWCCVGSGLTVHVSGLHQRASEARHQDQHGRQKGAWWDIVERLWRSVKYEDVYLHAYDSVSAARDGIGRYLDLYNRRRPHSSLDGMTPDQAFFGHTSTPPIRLAA